MATRGSINESFVVDMRIAYQRLWPVQSDGVAVLTRLCMAVDARKLQAALGRPGRALNFARGSIDRDAIARKAEL